MPTVGSGWGSDTALLSNTRWWWKNPLDPSMDMAVPVVSWDPQQVTSAGVFYPRGRDRAHVASGDIYGVEGTLVLRPLERDVREGVEALGDSKAVTLLQSVLGRQWYLARTGPRPEQLLKAEPGWRTTPLRDVHLVTFPLTEVSAP